MKRTFKTWEALQAFIECRKDRAVWSITVLHDDGCHEGHYHATATCRPEFVAERATVENWTEGQRNQAAWWKAGMS